MDLEIRVKGKKISLKHFINLRLRYSFAEDGTLAYPLYTQIVYLGKSVTFKSITTEYSDELPLYVKHRPDLPKGFDEKDVSFLNDVDKKILRIVRYEIEKWGEFFTLSSLPNKIKIYFSSAEQLILDDTRELLFEHTKYIFEQMESFEKKPNINEFASVLKYKNEDFESTLIQFQLIWALFKCFVLKHGTVTCFDWILGQKGIEFTKFVTQNKSQMVEIEEGILEYAYVHIQSLFNRKLSN